MDGVEGIRVQVDTRTRKVTVYVPIADSNDNFMLPITIPQMFVLQKCINKQCQRLLKEGV